MARTWYEVVSLQGSAAGPSTADGNGTVYDSAGALSAQQVEIVESAGGTATVTLEGTFDGVNWYALGYQQIDGIALPVRAAGDISVIANSAHVYQILDPYPSFRARQSATAAASITVRVYASGS